MTKEQKVVRNTIYLYLRVIILLIISLFSSRVLLSNLGADNFGLYTVVGGIVSLFSFVSGTLTSSAQRYFAVCFGKQDFVKLCEYYSIYIVIYACVALFIVVLGETIGLWYLLNKLVFPKEMQYSVIVVYEMSILTSILYLITTPFIALIIADENMKIYSSIAICEGIMQLFIAFGIELFGNKKLIIYSLMLFFCQFIVSVFYVLYCKKKYAKVYFLKHINKREFREIISFSSWNMIGAFATVGKAEGINIIFNNFCGNVVVAARSNVFQMNSAILSFSQNFLKAIEPYMTKKIVAEDNTYVSTIYASSKLAFFLQFFWTLPLCLNIDYILKIWLKEIPQYTREFAILILIDSLVLNLTDSLGTAIQANGKVKRYQLTTGVLSLLNIPLSYIVLSRGLRPELPFIISIIISVLMSISRIINVKRYLNFSITKYCQMVLLPIFIMSIICIILTPTFSNAKNFTELFINTVVCGVIEIFVFFCLVTTKKEKKIILQLIKKAKNE